MDSEPVAGLTPKRVAIFLTGVEGSKGDLEEAIAAVIEDAESRGLFIEWAAIGEMEMNDVIPNSPLHHALIGQFPDR